MIAVLFMCQILCSTKSLNLWSLIKERILSLIPHVLICDNLLSTANKQISSRNQTFLELTKYFILCFFSKINQYISADNQMTIRWI